MFFTIIADVVPESQRHLSLPIHLTSLTISRAYAFFQITAATLVATVAGVPLAYWLMKYSVWLPMVIGACVVIFGVLFIFLLPETLDRHQVHRPSGHGAQESLLPSSSTEQEEDEEAPASFSKKNLSGILLRIEESRFVFKSPLLCALAFTFLVRRLDRDSIQLLFQLASKRFNWSLGEVSSPVPTYASFPILTQQSPVVFPNPPNLHHQLRPPNLHPPRNLCPARQKNIFGPNNPRSSRSTR